MSYLMPHADGEGLRFHLVERISVSHVDGGRGPRGTSAVRYESAVVLTVSLSTQTFSLLVFR